MLQKNMRTICTHNIFITYNTYLIAPVLKKLCQLITFKVID